MVEVAIETTRNGADLLDDATFVAAELISRNAVRLLNCQTGDRPNYPAQAERSPNSCVLISRAATLFKELS
jgi:hypothetical protein